MSTLRAWLASWAAAGFLVAAFWQFAALVFGAAYAEYVYCVFPGAVLTGLLPHDRDALSAGWSEVAGVVLLGLLSNVALYCATGTLLWWVGRCAYRVRRRKLTPQ